MKRCERSAARDRALGMNRLIDRRDFLNGAAVALGTALAGPAFGATPQDVPGYYPPGLTGMRGSHRRAPRVARLQGARRWPRGLAPGAYHDSIRLNSTVDVGGYRSVRSADEPILVRMTRAPCAPGLDPRSQFQAGRRELMSTSFGSAPSATSSRILAPADSTRRPTSSASRSIAGRTAMPTNTTRCSIPTGTSPDQPHVVGRAPFGRIVIANSDSGAGAYYRRGDRSRAWHAVNEALAIAG